LPLDESFSIKIIYQIVTRYNIYFLLYPQDEIRWREKLSTDDRLAAVSSNSLSDIFEKGGWTFGAIREKIDFVRD